MAKSELSHLIHTHIYTYMYLHTPTHPHIPRHTYTYNITKLFIASKTGIINTPYKSKQEKSLDTLGGPKGAEVPLRSATYMYVYVPF